ncbi:MAG: class I tRNA ligase family protein [Candidatus Paceibacterota bacterium]
MEDYNFKKIEKKWQEEWQDKGVYEPDLESAEDPYYNLMMFPYPSAEGLHVGNMYAFTGADIYGRFKRMQGFDVFEPIGLDGFGIHSENYAIKIGTHPVDQSKKSEKNFYKQLEMIGNGFAWNEKLETYDPEYYKWTQWLFIKLFENGLAYRKKSPVNWCPSCKTVLADEQVENGKCERCSNEVERKNLEQWFFKITNYADALLDDLEELDWSKNVKIAQSNWIGRSEGALINFNIKDTDESLEVFTTRPDTINGVTYMVLAPEHEVLEKLEGKINNLKEVSSYIEKAKNKSDQQRREEAGEKTGVEVKGLKAINPVNKKELPVWVADYVLSGYGTGAIMAVPSLDERDGEFAEKFNLPIIEEELMDFNEAIEKSGGEKHTNYKLRDWLISRQRYWGPPIPLVFCKKCFENVKKNPENYSKGEVENPGWVAVKEDSLPIKLPYIEDFRPKGKGQSPLASDEKFYKTKCPKCGENATRETDVSDTFLDSSWYYYRYIDKDNKDSFSNEKRVKKWLPVDMYIGGEEHSVLHLLYTRFITKALNDFGFIDFDEPFKKFRAHGLLIKEGTKMSKSKGNVINPDEYIEKFGADVLRTYLMFLAPFEEGGDFRDAGIMGIDRFINRVWKTIEKVNINNGSDIAIETPIKVVGKGPNYEDIGKPRYADENLEKQVHKSIKKVTSDIKKLKYNTAISELMILLSYLEEHKHLNGTSNYKEFVESFLKLLAPFAPHITEELWRNTLGNETSIHKEKWPKHNEELIKESDFELIIQVNGKVRDTVKVSKGINRKDAEKIAKELDGVAKYLDGNNIKKVIFVEDKLINFVI